MYIGSDHGGAVLRQQLTTFVRQTWPDLDIVEFGSSDEAVACDYPKVAHALGEAVVKDEGVGVLVCGTGIGISIAANKVPGVRCALVHDAFTARMAKEHNNANVLAFGGRVVGVEVAKDALNVFMSAKFQGGRHQGRLDQMEC